MAQKIGDLDYYELPFRSNGAVADAARHGAMLSALDDPTVRDAFVISHGWRNDAGDAQGLYQTLFKNVSTLLKTRGRAGERAVVVGVFWPSEPWYQGLEGLPAAGGAASLGGAAADRSLVERELDKLAGLVTDDPAAASRIQAARARLDQLKTSAGLDAFVADVRGAVTPNPTDPDDDASDQLLRAPASEVIRRIGAQGPRRSAAAASSGAGVVIAPPSSGGAGAAAEISLSSIFKAAANLVEKLSYYEMKERAGRIGTALNAVLKQARDRRPNLRIHLIGHSFGARLVTSAALGPATIKPASLSLLQAAFSHNAFSGDYDGKGKPGFFRAVAAPGRVDGPIVITYSKFDRAVGLAYPAASRLMRQNASGYGEADDPFGALGRNGAQKMTDAERKSVDMLRSGQPYSLARGVVHNIKGDAYIRLPNEKKDAHGEVTGPEVAHLILSAAGF